jgi:hypothetical protein
MGQFFDIIKPFAGSECVVIFVRISSQNLDFYQFSLALKKHQIEQCLAPKKCENNQFSAIKGNMHNSRRLE